jgi:hypothetical protein
MPYDHNTLINSGAIPAFINILNNYTEDPSVLSGPLTMLAGITKDSENKDSVYDNHDIVLSEAIFKVISANSENKEILTKCIAILTNIDTKIVVGEAKNAILFCQTAAFCSE